MKIDPDAQQIFAVGFLILCILLGMGGCGYLWDKGDASMKEPATIHASTPNPK